MDITEAFRAEDISKTDFFDFVVTPENTQSFQTFSKQMRAVNVFLEEETSEMKETNNNTLIDTQQLPSLTDNESSTNASAYDATFWNCDKETVKLETAILEDLNKYCWSQDAELPNCANGTCNKITNNNTDGHIYTLTVLNGVEQPTWYRPPISSIVKEEDTSLSSPSPMEHIPQPSLDIESILNSIPSTLNGYTNGYEPSSHESLTTDGLIKSETFTYDDSGYADTKDEITNSLIIGTPMLEPHDSFNNNNNNDWKIDNNNSSTPDSLLRSALQGKAFVRYNGQKKIESHSELRRVLSTPPVKTEPTTEPDTMLVAHLNNNIVMFDDGGGGRITDSDNPSSTQSMDDILLSQLDSASFPEDYEKLKRIANEVAESVQQYCHLEPIETIFVNTQAELSSTPILTPPTMNPPAMVTSTKPTAKKYKRSNSGSAKQNTSSANVQTATSTSNGVRKERSLHYCSICSKGFKDKYSVNVHIRTHTGEKPFACSLCGKSFRQKAHLAKHYQTHIAQKNAAAAGNAAGTKKAGGNSTSNTSNNTSVTTGQTVPSPTSVSSVASASR